MLQIVARHVAFEWNSVFLGFQHVRCKSVVAHRAQRLPFGQPFSEVPRIPALPLVGSSWIYMPLVGQYDKRDINKRAWQMYRRYGPVVAETLPGRRLIVHLFDADDFRTLFQEEGKTPYRMGAQPFKLYHDNRPQYFANPGIINAQGEEWRQIRTMFQPSSLRPRTVQTYAAAIGQVASDVLDLITASRDENGDVPGCDFIMNRWALESITAVSLGTRLGLLEKRLHRDSQAFRIFQAIDDIFKGLDTLVTQFPYYRYVPTPTSRIFDNAGDTLVPILWRFTKDAVDAARAGGENSPNTTLLHHAWRNQKAGFKELFTFIHDLVISGANTTGAAASFALQRLATNPEVQEKARQEVMSFSLAESQGSPDSSFESELPFLKACIRETLRFHPIIPGVNLKLNQDVVMSGYHIPAGTVLRTELYVAGQLEQHFTRPSEFLPERWLRSGDSASEDAWTLHPFASLPFGIGPRTCIGKKIAEMELCILLAAVLKKYRVENHHGDIGFLTQSTARPERPAKFRFVELNSTT
ncbi:putative cytochrome P450 49a1 isoform X2 [Amblyomma americanum]